LHAEATAKAADRRVRVRIDLDANQLAQREPTKVFNDLAGTPGVEIRAKHRSSDPMHLKSYRIDGRLLRTGAANFSASLAALRPLPWSICVHVLTLLNLMDYPFG